MPTNGLGGSARHPDRRPGERVRVRSHLELDSKRATIIQNIESSEKRLEELRAQQTTTSPPDVSAVHLAGQGGSVAGASLTVPSADCQGPNPKRTCRREEFVPHCDEEMQEWIEGRQRDLQAAGRATPRGGEDLPTLVQGSAGVATDHRRAGPGMPPAVANMVRRFVFGAG